MPAKTLATSDDPLGLADGTTIILISHDPAAVQDAIETQNESGEFIDADAVKPRTEHSVEYELASGSHAFTMNAPMNTDYLITSLAINQMNSSRVRVTATITKPSAAAKILTTISKTVTVVGGIGIQNLFGITTSACVLSCNGTISGTTLEALQSDGLDYCAAGLATYGLKNTVTAEAYGAMTKPSGGFATSISAPKKSNTGFDIHSLSFFIPV